MNLTALREYCFRYLGYHQSSQRPNYLRQEVDDAINLAVQDIKDEVHYYYDDVRQTTISVVSGTNTYEVEDVMLLPISLWTEGTAAHKIELVHWDEVLRSGLKNNDIIEGTYGPYIFRFYPGRTTASKSMTCSITEADATLTRSAGDSFASSDVGKRVRINGEEMEYLIASYTDANNVELDRNYRGRLTGEATDGLSGNSGSVTCEVSPPNAWQLEFEPEPSASQTVYVLYIRKTRQLLHGAEVPQFPEQWHKTIATGALKRLSAYTEDPPGEYAKWAAVYASDIKKIKAKNKPVDAPGRVFYTAPIRRPDAVRRTANWPVDLDFRR